VKALPTLAIVFGLVLAVSTFAAAQSACRVASDCAATYGGEPAIFECSQGECYCTDAELCTNTYGGGAPAGSVGFAPAKDAKTTLPFDAIGIVVFGLIALLLLGALKLTEMVEQ